MFVVAAAARAAHKLSCSALCVALSVACAVCAVPPHELPRGLQKHMHACTVLRIAELFCALLMKQNYATQHHRQQQ
jgi:hypothetical protein